MGVHNVEHDPVSASYPTEFCNTLPEQDRTRIWKKLYRMRCGYTIRVDHCSRMFNQRFFGYTSFSDGVSRLGLGLEARLETSFFESRSLSRRILVSVSSS